MYARSHHSNFEEENIYSRYLSSSTLSHNSHERIDELSEIVFRSQFHFHSKSSQLLGWPSKRDEIFRDYVMSVLQRSSAGPSNDEDDDDGDQKR